MQNCVFCPVAKKFCWSVHLAACNFSATVWGCSLPKMFGNWKYVSPIFGPCLLWPSFWIDHDTTWYRGTPQLRRHCVRWGPSFLFHSKGTASPLSASFWPTALARILTDPQKYCQLCSVRRAAVVAVLLDNCHPSTVDYINVELIVRQWHCCSSTTLGRIFWLKQRPAAIEARGHSELGRNEAVTTNRLVWLYVCDVCCCDTTPKAIITPSSLRDEGCE